MCPDVRADWLFVAGLRLDTPAAPGRAAAFPSWLPVATLREPLWRRLGLACGNQLVDGYENRSASRVVSRAATRAA